MIDWLARKEEARALLGDLGREGMYISIITFGEVYDGIYHGRAPDLMEASFKEFLLAADVVTVDQEAMKVLARVRGGLRRQGELLPDADLLIAATALRHNLELVTRNTRHFVRVPGLRLYEPASAST